MMTGILLVTTAIVLGQTTLRTHVSGPFIIILRFLYLTDFYKYCFLFIIIKMFDIEQQYYPQDGE